jgi:hypothetical protein
MPRLRLVVVGSAALRVERLDDGDGEAVESAAVLSLAVDDPVAGVGRGERCGQVVAIVCPSGQPIRRSHSTGVNLLTDDVTSGDGLSARPGLPVVPESNRDCANDVNAFSSSVGSARPRFDARRRMPVAARADSENRCGALGCNTSRRVVGTASQTEDEYPSSALGHSEVASVENPVRHAVPEFRHATEERRHVSPSMAGEESRYVFEEDGGRSVSLHKVEEREGEAAAGGVVGAPVEAAPLPGDAEVLAGEAAGPENST